MNDVLSAVIILNESSRMAQTYRSNFNVYQDFSTTLTGNVNTKGDTIIGGGASIE